MKEIGLLGFWGSVENVQLLDRILILLVKRKGVFLTLFKAFFKISYISQSRFL
jgi:hypothetical protein